MSGSPQERREYQRIKLDLPLGGRFGPTNVLILDVGLGGALLEHHAPITLSEKRKLTFLWDGHELAFNAELVQTNLSRLADSERVFASNLHFLDGIGDSDRQLRRMIGAQVAQALDLQKANARGLGTESIGDATVSRLITVRTEAPRQYISCRLSGSQWKRTPTQKTTQPPDGFTVSASEADVDLLCRTYQASDQEGRRLIRALAELSLSTGKLSRVRYEP